MRAHPADPEMSGARRRQSPGQALLRSRTPARCPPGGHVPKNGSRDRIRIGDRDRRPGLRLPAFRHGRGSSPASSGAGYGDVRLWRHRLGTHSLTLRVVNSYRR